MNFHQISQNVVLRETPSENQGKNWSKSELRILSSQFLPDKIKKIDQ